MINSWLDFRGKQQKTSRKRGCSRKQFTLASENSRILCHTFTFLQMRVYVFSEVLETLRIYSNHA